MPQEEDRRHICRERRTLVGERVRRDLKVLTTLRTCCIGGE